MSEDQERAAVVELARGWLGTPYHHQGRLRGVGVDCAMLLIEVYACAGLIENFDPGYYPSDWMLNRSEERYLGWVQKYAKPTEQPRPGDVVVFLVGRCFAHGAIIVDWPRAIHARFRASVELVDFEADHYFVGRERRFYTLWPRAS